ncbi:MAG TPA: GNAT family N-acetyltransferase [Streptosporangiaceae bacterium]|nr:GNAT family N-acetyltransferase [Streptosporangiaceae bacterium]
MSTYKKEREYDDKRWQSEFSRGEWTVGSVDGQDVCLLGVTEAGIAPNNHCLEYMWVDPEYRHQGIGFELVIGAMERLYRSGIQLVHLWILDGNNRAAELYKRLRFEFNTVEQLLDNYGRPGRKELQMDLVLTQEILDEARQNAPHAHAALATS